MRMRKIFFALSLALSGFSTAVISPSSFAKGCAEPLVNQCRQKGSKVMEGLNAGMTTAAGLSGNVSAGAQAGALGNCAQGMGGASGDCESLASQCKSKCSAAEVAQCEKEVREAAAQLAAQSGSCAANSAAAQSTQDGMSGGGMDPGALLGALAGLAGAMMQKKEEKPKDTGALRPDGSLDCSKADAYQFSDCVPHLQARCNSNMEDQLCANFSNTFCQGAGPGAGSAGPPAVLPGQPPAAGPSVPVNGGSGVSIQAAAVPMPPALQPGAGNGSGFCQMVVEYAYCRVGGRDSCPACLHLQQMKTPACQSNPAACMAQDSPEVIARSAQMCPGDPIVVAKRGQNGGTIPVGSSGPVGSPVTQLPGGAPVTGGANLPGGGGNLPVVVLPQSAEGRAAQLGMRTASASGAGVRDGQAPGGAGSRSGSGYSGSGSGSSYSGQSARATNSREVAGVLPRPRAAAIGPAPDVQGQFGPSVFAVGSQAIRNRCAAGKFLNCP